MSADATLAGGSLLRQVADVAEQVALLMLEVRRDAEADPPDARLPSGSRRAPH